MTDAERKAQLEVYQEAFKDALMPMLAEGETGVTAIRMFYAVRHGDGTVSAGNLGATAQDKAEDGVMLIRSIMGLLADVQKNRQIDVRETKPKS